MVYVIQNDAFDGIPHLRHGFFTRQGGISNAYFSTNNCALGKGDEVENVKYNRLLALERLGLSSSSLKLVNQVHGARVVVVHQHEQSHDDEQADGMITTCPQVALGILTADCCPVLIAHRQGTMVAAAHAGWRGTAAGILEATIAGMVAMGASPQDLLAALGPSIAQDSYEVQSDVQQCFPTHSEFFKPSIAQSHATIQHYLFDLPGLVQHKLESLGVQTTRLLFDTYERDDLFFSFRRKTHRQEPSCGCQLSLIAIDHPHRLNKK